ncbi:phosphopantetheine-binding protein [Nonomuraea sp. NPDC005650]|uniref:acyl carrier protein n=1 Tax=Nonomuraea sp. NPDC005650 TaxID=3157045 RepID=UPI0033AAFBAA
MSDEEVFQELRSICAKILTVDPARLSRDVDLREELEADSLDMAEIAAAMEDRFKLTVDLDTAQQARTLADVVALLQAAGA